MNVMRIDEIKDDLINYLKNKKLIPIFGSGLSVDCPTTNYGVVPSGSDYKQHMLSVIFKDMELSSKEKEEIAAYNFSKVCSLYEDDEYINKSCRKSHMLKNFYKVYYQEDDPRKKVLDIEWPYIYTLNVDDAIERNSEYSKVILPKRKIDEEIFNQEKCVIKLHGDISEIISYEDSCKVFTTKEYVHSLTDNEKLLQKLKNDFLFQNILFLGCSLDDEIDLMLISNICERFNDKSYYNRKIIFVKDKPLKYKLSEYKQFGITDVVYFNEYDDMYNELVKIWCESLKITGDELDTYKTYKTSKLETSFDDNKSYFYHGKGLIDIKNHCINIPCYYTQRTLSNRILNEIENYAIHIIKGNRISGKSYLMTDLYLKINDRDVYFFDSRNRITDDTLEILMSKSRTICLFDSGCLTREQFKKILSNYQCLCKSDSNFVISANLNDVDLLSTLNLKLKNEELDEKKINILTLSNRFNLDETNKINLILPKVDFLPFKQKMTILDNLINSEKKLNVNGRFSRVKLNFSTFKELAFYIALATKENLLSSEIIMFGLETEAHYAEKCYAPLIESVETEMTEKDSSDLSSRKYILNAKYWLCRNLGDLSFENANHDLVASSYCHLVKMILSKYKDSPVKQRNVYKKYILFDTINSIFVKEENGQLKLIVNIYSRLHEYLANDYNFLHQNAKCFLKYAQSRRGNDEKDKYLNEALKKAIVSFEMCDELCNQNSSEYMLISRAHIQYTIAIIRSELCELHGYKNESELNDTLECIYAVVKNPYYLNAYEDDNKNKSVVSNFVLNMLSSENDTDIKLKINEILDIIKLSKDKR